MLKFRQIIGSTILTLGITQDGSYVVQMDKESLSMTRYTHVSRMRTAAVLQSTNNGKKFLLVEDFLRLVLTSTSEDGQRLIQIVFAEGIASLYKDQKKCEPCVITGITRDQYFQLTYNGKS